MAAADEDRLDSWKEIAAYLKRDITTVQRWERREAMPVRRHLHDKLGSVYAFRSELDTWTQSRFRPSPGQRGTDPTADGPKGIADSVRLAELETPARPAGMAVPRRARTAWLVAGGALVVAVGVGGWMLERAEYFWRNPLADAVFQNVTDFGGTEQAAAISRDGRFVAFLSDHDGRMDVWVTQVGTGQFYNLTTGRVPELVNSSVRMLGFTPNGALVTFWSRGLNPVNPQAISVWAIPTLGGEPRPYLESAAELNWSANGSQLVYHTPAAGDPTFIKTSDEPGPGRSLLTAAPGSHAHFQTWSPSGQFIYFVQGSVPAPMDIWRVKPTGAAVERITFQDTQVSYPVLLDERTLIYLATGPDGSGPWLYSADVERRVPHRMSVGLDRYTSLAASADGRRVVATLAHSTRTLWRVSLTDKPAGGPAATPVALTTGQGFLPRLGPGYLVYVSSNATSDIIWKVVNGSATTLWTAADTRIVGGPEIASDGRRIAFSVRQNGKTRLYTINADGTEARVITDSLELEGAPAWAPNGQSLLSAADVNGTPNLFRIPLKGAPTLFVREYATDPVWSPDGRFVIYSDADIGTTFSLKAVTSAGAPYAIPHLVLARGERRLRFLAGPRTLLVLRGDLRHHSLWRADLQTGEERELTNLPPDFNVQDFDVSADGSELVLERAQQHSDVVLIDLAHRH